MVGHFSKQLAAEGPSSDHSKCIFLCWLFIWHNVSQGFRYEILSRLPMCNQYGSPWWYVWRLQIHFPDHFERSGSLKVGFPSHNMPPWAIKGSNASWKKSHIPQLVLRGVRPLWETFGVQDHSETQLDRSLSEKVCGSTGYIYMYIYIYDYDYIVDIFILFP